MNEIPDWIPGPPDFLDEVGNQNEQEIAFSQIQDRFRSNYEISANPTSLHEKNKTGKAFLSSLDYLDNVSPRHIVHRANGREIYLPYNPVVEGFEAIFEKDRDHSLPPIKFVQENERLPVIRSGNYTGKIGIVLSQCLYLIRTNFMLTPDGDIQRCVEQYIAALRMGHEVGEVWILNKWNPKFNFKPVDSAPRDLVLLG